MSTARCSADSLEAGITKGYPERSHLYSLYVVLSALHLLVRTEIWQYLSKLLLDSFQMEKQGIFLNNRTLQNAPE